VRARVRRRSAVGSAVFRGRLDRRRASRTRLVRRLAGASEPAV